MEVDFVLKIAIGAIGALLTVGAAVTGWVFNMVFRQINSNTKACNQLDHDLSEHQLYCSQNYVVKDDMRLFTDRVLTKLDAIEKAQTMQYASILEKMNEKADK